MAIDLEKISDSPHLLDILLQMEDVLDSLDIYVFKNWFKGEVAEGPNVRRYWLDFTLRYPYDKMPDPKAALRLLKHGIRVDFAKGTLKVENNDAQAMPPQASAEQEVVGPDTKIEQPKETVENTVWLVTISMPRRLIAQMSSEEMDFYDDDVDVDDVEDAKDTGLDDESAYMAGEDGQNAQQGADPNADPFGGGDPLAAGGPPPPQGGPR